MKWFLFYSSACLYSIFSVFYFVLHLFWVVCTLVTKCFFFFFYLALQVTHADFKKAKDKVMFKKKEGVPEGLYMWSIFINYPGLLSLLRSVSVLWKDVCILLRSVMGLNYHEDLISTMVTIELSLIFKNWEKNFFILVDTVHAFSAYYYYDDDDDASLRRNCPIQSSYFNRIKLLTTAC